MCLISTEILSHLFLSLLPFVIFLGVVMWLTNTIIDTKESQKNPVWIAIIKGTEPSRRKGLWIALSGGICGAVLTCFKSAAPIQYSWLYESIAQTAYIFASALATMYLVHGYKHADPNYTQLSKENENDAQ